MRLILIVLGTVLIGVPAGWCGGASVREERTEQGHTLAMENEYIRLAVDLRHGGRVTDFRYKPLDRSWVLPGQGLFADHLWQQMWPGELYNAPYEGEIVSRDPARVAVRVRRSLSEKNPVGYSGLMVERTISLSAGSPAVDVDVAMTNPSATVKAAGYWSQHLFQLGNSGDNVYIRPSVTGLDVAACEIRDEGRTRRPVGRDWVTVPVAGWTAVVNPTDGQAAVFLVDYHDLYRFYNCLGSATTEFYYDLVRMAPGRVWKTQITLLPLQGYHGISFASRQTVADVRLARSPEGFRLVYTAGCGGSPLANVVWKVELTSIDGKRVRGRETVAWKELTFQPTQYLSSLTLPGKGEPVVVKVEIAGPNFSQSFTTSFGDDNRQDRLVAGTSSTGYMLKRPEKVKVLDKPASLAKVPHEGFAVYEAQGQFFDAWKIKESLAAKGKFRLVPGHFCVDAYGEQLDYFPASYPEILALDMVVLNNVSAACLTPQDMALLKDYVHNGGSLLVLGGWYAFGGGHYADGGLAEMLPVICGSPFDIRRYLQGLPIQIVPDGPLANVPMVDPPVVQWLQEVSRLKEGATVVVTAGDKPLVVFGNYGKGRVACILASVTGYSTPKAPLFCETEAWPVLLGKILDWLREAGRP